MVCPAREGNTPVNSVPQYLDKSVALSLPEEVQLGSSSWAHPFWRGQIYHREYRSDKDFNLNSLSEFAASGLFSSVEIDSSFYAPPRTEVLEQYAALVPETFRFAAKIWERLSIPVFPDMRRYGKDAGKENASFLDPSLFLEKVLPPFQAPEFRKKFAAFLLQFPPINTEYGTSRTFLSRLEAFCAAIPSDISLAIEIRNGAMLTPAYLEILNRYRVSHCFNQWSSMLPVLEQMKLVAASGGLEARFMYARMITPLHMSFDRAGKLFEPFTELKQRDSGARQDLIRLARRAVQRGVPVFMFLNNRFEGNTPASAREIRSLMREALC